MRNPHNLCDANATFFGLAWFLSVPMARTLYTDSYKIHACSCDRREGYVLTVFPFWRHFLQQWQARQQDASRVFIISVLEYANASCSRRAVAIQIQVWFGARAFVSDLGTTRQPFRMSMASAWLCRRVLMNGIGQHSSRSDCLHALQQAPIAYILSTRALDSEITWYS